jgi:hypothetical protein
MSRWFRMYDEILDDPKVQKLPAEDFRAWVNILCLASKNEGVLPSADDIAFALRRSPNDVVTLLERLLNATLIDKRNGGPNGYHYAPHGWDKRQFKSDTSTDRVKRYRERAKEVSATPPEPDTESDTEQSPPTPRRAEGSTGGPDPERLALDLCKRAGIRNPGPAATAHVQRWLGDGIPETTIRNVVTQMAVGSPAATRSLKRFDLPIRREHAERRDVGLNGGARRYEPKTPGEIERAIRFAEDHGDAARAAELRSKLEAFNLMQTKGRA